MPRCELDGLRVMVTRPAHQAAHLADLVRQAGGRPFVFPVLEILEPEDSGPLLQVIERLDAFDLAIFISPNAVNKTLNLIHARRTLPPGLKLACVGKGSAKALREVLGRDPDVFPRQKFDSEALLAMPALQQVAGQRIVIFRGDGGREHLADTLRERGAEVTYANAYRRGRPPADLGKLQRAWARGDVDLITITSGEGLRNLFDMVGKLGQQWLRRTQLVVVHERLVALARELGFKLEPLVADEASDEAIMEAICRWRCQRDSSDGPGE